MTIGLFLFPIFPDRYSGFEYVIYNISYYPAIFQIEKTKLAVALKYFPSS